MKTYNIYTWESEEAIGEVEASSIVEAELKAGKIFNMSPEVEIYALTKED